MQLAQVGSREVEQNLQDVEHIKLKADRLFHRITRDDTALSQARMMENFLCTANERRIKYVGDQQSEDVNVNDILVEYEAAEDSKATI